LGADIDTCAVVADRDTARTMGRAMVAVTVFVAVSITEMVSPTVAVT